MNQQRVVGRSFSDCPCREHVKSQISGGFGGVWTVTFVAFLAQNRNDIASKVYFGRYGFRLLNVQNGVSEHACGKQKYEQRTLHPIDPELKPMLPWVP